MDLTEGHLADDEVEYDVIEHWPEFLDRLRRDQERRAVAAKERARWMAELRSMPPPSRGEVDARRAAEAAKAEARQAAATAEFPGYGVREFLPGSGWRHEQAPHCRLSHPDSAPFPAAP